METSGRNYLLAQRAAHEKDDHRLYGFSTVLLSTSDSASETDRLVETNQEGTDIPGEYRSMTDTMKVIPEEEKLRITSVDDEIPPKRSPKSPKTKSSMIANKKGLHLQLNVKAAVRHNMQRNFSQNISHLTPGSTGTPKPMNVAVFLKEGEGRLLLLEKGKITNAGEIKQMMLENLSIPKNLSHVFAIWFISPHLELQLKDHHIPFLLRKQWADMLAEFTHCEEDERLKDEPVLVFQRNSFLSSEEEQKVTNEIVIKRLFEEAKHNILKPRYPVPVGEAEILGGMIARVALGPFDADKHQPGCFKKKLSKYLPYYTIGRNKLIQAIRHSGSEQRLRQQYERATHKYCTTTACQKEFLNYCHSLPFYGCAYFKGCVIQDGSELRPWKSCEKSVTVGINRMGITLFDGNKAEVLIHLPYDDLSWECIRDEGDEIFCIEYDAAQDGKEAVPEQIQIISKQSDMMDSMVTSCVNFLNIMNIPKTPTSADYKKILDISYSTIPCKKNNFSLTRPFKR